MRIFQSAEYSTDVRKELLKCFMSDEDQLLVSNLSISIQNNTCSMSHETVVTCTVVTLGSNDHSAGYYSSMAH